ncbi:NYN domain-containing protein [Spiroplasma poulsonii]|nr:NYN domain-containing protein [Spiroplasma poulsonii]
MKKVFYSNFEDKKLSEKLKKLGLMPIIQLPYSTGKNATDIRMTIEEMDLVFNKHYINAICLATNDSDFAPLTMTLREQNIQVIGAGNKEDISEEFKNLYHKFINIDKIKNNNKESKKIGSDIKSLTTLVNNIINEISTDDGFAEFSQVISLLIRRKSDFDTRNYGFNNTKTLSFFKEKLADYYEIKLASDNQTAFIKINSKTKLKKCAYFKHILVFLYSRLLCITLLKIAIFKKIR